MKNLTAKEHFGYAVTIRRLFEGCTNEFGEPCFTNKETGEIRCFGGRLNPRPSYQRVRLLGARPEKGFRDVTQSVSSRHDVLVRYRRRKLRTYRWATKNDFDFEHLNRWGFDFDLWRR